MIKDYGKIKICYFRLKIDAERNSACQLKIIFCEFNIYNLSLLLR